jgi:hypothetical protein
LRSTHAASVNTFYRHFELVLTGNTRELTDNPWTPAIKIMVGKGSAAILYTAELLRLIKDIMVVMLAWISTGEDNDDRVEVRRLVLVNIAVRCCYLAPLLGASYRHLAPMLRACAANWGQSQGHVDISQWTGSSSQYVKLSEFLTDEVSQTLQMMLWWLHVATLATQRDATSKEFIKKLGLKHVCSPLVTKPLTPLTRWPMCAEYDCDQPVGMKDGGTRGRFCTDYERFVPKWTARLVWQWLLYKKMPSRLEPHADTFLRWRLVWQCLY